MPSTEAIFLIDPKPPGWPWRVDRDEQGNAGEQCKGER